MRMIDTSKEKMKLWPSDRELFRYLSSIADTEQNQETQDLTKKCNWEVLRAIFDWRKLNEHEKKRNAGLLWNFLDFMEI